MGAFSTCLKNLQYQKLSSVDVSSQDVKQNIVSAFDGVKLATKTAHVKAATIKNLDPISLESKKASGAIAPRMGAEKVIANASKMM